MKTGFAALRFFKLAGAKPGASHYAMAFLLLQQMYRTACYLPDNSRAGLIFEAMIAGITVAIKLMITAMPAT